MAGIIETIQRMGLMLVLIPVAFAGVSMFFEGQRTAGAGLMGIALIIWLVSEYVKSPTDVGTSAAEKAAETVVKDPDDE